MDDRAPLPAAFDRAAATALTADGWQLVSLPAGLTLADLRARGAPFKGERYFSRQAAETVEHTTIATEVAYRPALLAGSQGLSFERAAALVDALGEHLPTGAAPCVAPAAAYVWLFESHRARHAAYPFVQRYTWAVDIYQGRARLVVGAFGQHRPLVVAPHTEGYGAGVGVWPLVVPRAALGALWPPVDASDPRGRAPGA